MSLTALIKEKAYALGFDPVGVVPAGRAPHADAYRHWLAQGYAGEMAWLTRDPARREDLRQVWPAAVSVVVVGLFYFTHNPPAEVWADPSRGRIARYAWGPDYHDLLLPRLRELGDFVEKEAGQAVNRRVYVDTGPILERDFAAQSGLSFIGKNTMAIRPKLGSYLFLGEILVDIKLEYDTTLGHFEERSDEKYPQPLVNKNDGGDSSLTAFVQNDMVGTCGRCTRCLEACPTRALAAPYTLDSRRCISYLTIENKGAIPLDLRPLLGNWIFGCDICQEVCPWVRRYAGPPAQPLFHYDPHTAAPRLLDLMALDEAGFHARFSGTPLVRAKRRGLLRNVAVALGNGGHPDAAPVLRQALTDPEPLIREHAAWALTQIK